MTRKIITFAAAVAATFASTAPLMAQDSLFEPSSRIVRYDDLDLANERGRERLETRLRNAANAACGFWQARTLAEKQAAEQCRSAALDKARTDAAAAKKKAAKRN